MCWTAILFRVVKKPPFLIRPHLQRTEVSQVVIRERYQDTSTVPGGRNNVFEEQLDAKAARSE